MSHFGIIMALLVCSSSSMNHVVLYSLMSRWTNKFKLNRSAISFTFNSCLVLEVEHNAVQQYKKYEQIKSNKVVVMVTWQVRSEGEIGGNINIPYCIIMVIFPHSDFFYLHVKKILVITRGCYYCPEACTSYNFDFPIVVLTLAHIHKHKSFSFPNLTTRGQCCYTGAKSLNFHAALSSEWNSTACYPVIHVQTTQNHLPTKGQHGRNLFTVVCDVVRLSGVSLLL